MDYYKIGGIYSIGSTSDDTGYYANVYSRDLSKNEYLTDVGISVADYHLFYSKTVHLMNNNYFLKILHFQILYLVQQFLLKNRIYKI